MSLRLRLIGLVALFFIGSLAVGGTIACLNAARSVETEMRSALQVGRQTIAEVIDGLGGSADPRHGIESLVASFRGNRHLRVFLAGDNAASVAPAAESPPIGSVPNWFVRLIGVAPAGDRLPVSIDGRDYGTVVIETDPRNEILEIWNEFGDSVLVMALFGGPTMLLIYFFIGRALRPLARLAAGLERVGEGDYSTRLAGGLPRELAPLRDSFNRMARQLAGMAAENRRLNEQLLTLQEEERSDLARDLHDEVGPFLFAVNVDAANIARLAAEGRPADIPAVVQSIVEAMAHLHKQVRNMLGRLRPVGLDEFGLVEAIGTLVDFWRRRHPEIDYRVSLPRDGHSFGDLADTTIYRLVQECLSNAVRHARPRGIAVMLEQRGDEAILEVADDGPGLGDAARLGFGLIGMRERVAAMGGSLILKETAGGGLTVAVRLPGSPMQRALAS